MCCPLHREDFDLEECHEIALSPDKVLKMEVACWNSPRGCRMMGSLARVLEHFERDCGFHEAICGRCEARVVQSDIANHLMRGCSGGNAEPTTAVAQVLSGSPGDLASALVPRPLTLEDVKEALTELKGMLATNGSNVLSVLETKVNELTETVLSLGANILELSGAEKRARVDPKSCSQMQSQSCQKSAGGYHLARLPLSVGSSVTSAEAVPQSLGAEKASVGTSVDDSAGGLQDGIGAPSSWASSFITHVEVKAPADGPHYMTFSGWEEFKKQSLGAGDSHVYATCTVWNTDKSWVRVLILL